MFIIYTSNTILNTFFFSGFMHAHISYLAEDCQACLVLLTNDHNLFHPLSDAKKKITEVSCIQILLSINLIFMTINQ